MRNSKRIFNFILPVLFLGLVACSTDNNEQEPLSQNQGQYQNSDNTWYENEVTIKGNALGTYCVVKTSDDTLLISPQEVEDLFIAFNAELSTYSPTSLISRFNDVDSTLDLNKTRFFKKCFETSLGIYEATNGTFDPAVFPLLNLWGFVKEIKELPSQQEIDSVLAFSGFENNILYSYQAGILSKKDSRFRLVFNAIAKGQAVDELALILEEKGQDNYYVEVGGEIRVKGVNAKNTKWIIGIDEPVTSNTGLDDEEARPIENYIEITDKSMATSGNYREFYTLNGEVYGHTISPLLGRPVNSNILSATVIADEVAVADAFATAFMVMGVDSALNVIKNHPEYNLDAYLLYEGEDGRIQRAYNKGMLNYLFDK